MKRIFTLLLISFFLQTSSGWAMGSESGEMAHELNGWSGNQHFGFSNTDGIYHVFAEKSPWESFSVQLSEQLENGNLVVRFRVRSNQKLGFSISISDGLQENPFSLSVNDTYSGSGEFETLSFDFSGQVEKLDASIIPFLVIWVNPGQAGKLDFLMEDFRQNNQKSGSTLAEPAGKAQLNVYPNPAQGSVQVDLPEGLFHTLILRDLSGREVQRQDISKTESPSLGCDLSGLPGGTYIVSIVNDTQVISSRLLVE